jgi:hypothetical protein
MINFLISKRSRKNSNTLFKGAGVKTLGANIHNDMSTRTVKNNYEYYYSKVKLILSFVVKFIQVL